MLLLYTLKRSLVTQRVPHMPTEANMDHILDAMKPYLKGQFELTAIIDDGQDELVYRGEIRSIYSGLEGSEPYLRIEPSWVALREGYPPASVRWISSSKLVDPDKPLLTILTQEYHMQDAGNGRTSFASRGMSLIVRYDSNDMGETLTLFPPGDVTNIDPSKVESLRLIPSFSFT